MMPGRRYSEGLHQAIEAKEGVRVQRENVTLATITFQNYFRMYEKLAGMTGTAMTEAEEFRRIYNLDVVVDPDATGRWSARISRPGLQERRRQVQARSSRRSRSCTTSGRPVLVGTASIEKSERLSRAAQRKRHRARGAEREAARARGGDHRCRPASPAR